MPDDDDARFSITLKDVYNAVQQHNAQVADALHRIDLLARDIVAVQKDQAALEHSTAELKTDVESLKKSRWPIPSVAVVVAFLGFAYSLLRDTLRS